MIGRRIAVHLTVLAVGAGVLRVAVLPAEICPAVTAAQVTASIESAAGWLIGGMQPDGSFTYGYDRLSGDISRGYSDARHAGVTVSLFQVYEALGDRPALDAGERGLRYALSRLVERDGFAAWNPGGDIPTGANGLLLAAMAIRRRATGDHTLDDVMRSVGRFLLTQQYPDGSVSAYWSKRQPGPRLAFGPFATGEAAWALALLDREFPGEQWGEAAGRTLDYMASGRNAKEGYAVSLPDHWGAYTAAELGPELLSDSRVDYARRLAGFFGIRLRFEAQRRGTGLNLWLRWYPGPPAGVGTAGEGIGALHRLSRTDPRLGDLTASIEDRLVCTAGMMVDRQVTVAQAAESDRPALETGAWFYRGRTQMDDQQHVVSALLTALPVVKAMEEER